MTLQFFLPIDQQCICNDSKHINSAH